jgi:RNA polymerase sigma factor (sigma-70 family)
MQDLPSASVPGSEAMKSDTMPNDAIQLKRTTEENVAGLPLAAATDEQLMVAFARGQSDAFNDLFLRYKQPLFGFFRRRTGDASAAEELTQETFLAVLRASSRYQACALFRTYLYAIGFKMLRAHRRKSAFRAAFWMSSTAGSEPSAETAVEAEMVIRQALGKLDGMEREILMLREYEQLSYAEIAALMELPVNTVRSRLFRARSALRELLASPAPGSTREGFIPTEGRA